MGAPKGSLSRSKRRPYQCDGMRNRGGNPKWVCFNKLNKPYEDGVSWGSKAPCVETHVHYGPPVERPSRMRLSANSSDASKAAHRR